MMKMERQNRKPLTSSQSNGDSVLSSGKLRGLIESYGYQVPSLDGDGSTTKTGVYPDMLDQLDRLAYTFANLFNEIHSSGYDMDGEQGTSQFFTMKDGSSVVFSDDDQKSYQGAAKDILLGNLLPSDIAASSADTAGADDVATDAGNGLNAINLANISGFILTNTNQNLEGLPSIDLAKYSVIDNGSINAFYESMIGGLGVDAQQANRLKGNSEILRESVNTNRQSVSSVSLDEEMTNIIKFQHAYNAAARQITVMDELLDKVINGMGVVGR